VSEIEKSGEAASRLSRRIFVQQLAGGAGALLMSTILPDLALAHAHVQEKVAQGKAGEFEFFTPEQAKEVDAICSQIIPTDDSPGAHEAHVVNFIDHALAKYDMDMQPEFLKALGAFTTEAHKQVSSAGHFHELDSAQQKSVMTSLEKSEAFQTLKFATVLGFFSDPKHGGNRDQIGWKLIQFDNAGMYEPPFGYYDAELLANDKKEGQ
jgi:gluconate 2-dehydrogenase gamma chain